MQYLRAKVKKVDKDEAYQIYVTDRLQAITGVNLRYADVAYGTVQKEQDSDEIISNLKDKIKKVSEE